MVPPNTLVPALSPVLNHATIGFMQSVGHFQRMRQLIYELREVDLHAMMLAASAALAQDAHKLLPEQAS